MKNLSASIGNILFLGAVSLLFLNPASATGGFMASLNGGDCSFTSIQAAVDAAVDGDTVIVASGTHNEFGITINKDIALVGGVAMAPNFTGCEAERPDAMYSQYRIDAGGQMVSSGGVISVSGSSNVRIRNIWFQNGLANNGGQLAISDGSSVTLQSVQMTGSEANVSGGAIYVFGFSNAPSKLVIEESSALLDAQASLGGIIASEFGTVVIRGNSLVGIFAASASDAGGVIYAFESDLQISENAVINNGETNEKGGGIYLENSRLDINDARIHSNLSNNEGGAIYALDSSVNLNAGSQIDNNTAWNKGGGVFLLDSNLTTSSSAVNENKTLFFGGNFGGGGLYLENTTSIISGSEIKLNVSETLGGGILQLGGSLTVNGASVIEENQTETFGGGLLSTGILNVDGSQFINNTASFGGGIDCTFECELNISNGSIIRENQAGSGAGLAFGNFPSSRSHTIANSSFINNEGNSDTSTSGGGGIYIRKGTLSLTNVDFIANSSLNYGGAIFLDSNLDQGDVEFSVLNGVFENNTADQGGGIYSHSLDQFTVNASLFESNSSESVGGGIHSENSTLDIADSSFTENECASGGCAISAFNGTLNISQNSSISDHNSNGSGAGIRVLNGTLNLNQVTMIRNTSQAFGGALALNSSDATINNSHFENNESQSEGGAIFTDGSTLLITSLFGNGMNECDVNGLLANEYCSTFKDNESAASGGAVSVFDTSDVTIEHTFFDGNNASVQGAVLSGADIGSSGNGIIFRNNLVANNGSFAEQPSMIFFDGSTGPKTLASVTLTENIGETVRVDGGSATVNINNSIFFNNESGSRIPAGVNLSVNCNNTQSEIAGTQSLGSFIGDPLFETTQRGDFRLSEFSVSRDQCSESLTTDMDGFARDDGFNDQGAFEFRLPGEIPIFKNGFE